MTLDELRARRDEILAIAARHGAYNVRVFGSVPDGRARPNSDVDFLVDFEPGRAIGDHSELILDLQEALGRDVDVVDLRRPSRIAERIKRNAVLLDSLECRIGMTDEERERERLLHIQETIGHIERYTRDGRHAFFQEHVIQDAVLYRLEILADVTSKLPESLKSWYPALPCNELCHLRNLAAQACENIDPERVWEMVADHLPAMKAMVEEELGRGQPSEPER